MKKHLTGSIVCGILTAFGIVSSIVSLAGGVKGIWTVSDVMSLAVSALIGYYAFVGYRKPHGNLLKTIIVISTVIPIIAVYQYARLGLPWRAIIATIGIGLCCYVAGRLHRVKQNIIFMSIVLALRIVAVILCLRDGILTIGTFTHIIIWIDIFVAYVLRYKEHKEAGLQDAPKK